MTMCGGKRELALSHHRKTNLRVQPLRPRCHFLHTHPPPVTTSATTAAALTATTVTIRGWEKKGKPSFFPLSPSRGLFHPLVQRRHARKTREKGPITPTHAVSALAGCGCG